MAKISKSKYFCISLRKKTTTKYKEKTNETNANRFFGEFAFGIYVNRRERERFYDYYRRGNKHFQPNWKSVKTFQASDKIGHFVCSLRIRKAEYLLNFFKHLSFTAGNTIIPMRAWKPFGIAKIVRIDRVWSPLWRLYPNRPVTLDSKNLLCNSFQSLLPIKALGNKWNSFRSESNK